MSKYKKMIIAVDLSEDSAPVAEAAQGLAAGSGAELHLIHVIEPLSFAYGGDIPMDFSGIQDEIHQQAVQQVQQQLQVWALRCVALHWQTCPAAARQRV